MIDLQHVTTFLAVVETGGFREAARRTRLSQPAVTQHVKQLERSLNVVLIERHPAGSALTSAGRAFLPFALSLVRIAQRAHALFTANRIAVGTSSNAGIYLLQPHLKAFKDTSPHDVDVAIADNPTVARMLEQCEVDVGIMEWWVDKPGFRATVWRREELVVIVPPDHEWAERQVATRDMIGQAPLLGGEPGTGTRTLLKNWLGAEPSSAGTARLGSTEAVKRAVCAGLGVSLVMRSSVANEVQAGMMRALPVDGGLAKDIMLVWRDVSTIAHPAQRFVDFLRTPR